jgi:predicted membrane-bound mannosyltransferase/sugar lactone lactonase YvrE
MEQKRNWLERPIHPALPNFTNELALFVIVILLAIITRFYNLGARVMSHDESLHTYFSWLLYRGQGYQHSPMMHGPFQFHIVALTYFLFGASDFTSRIPAALFSIATVWMVWYWRRYLGTWGAIIAGLLLVISPYMLFYGRYVRNESFVGLSGMIMLYAILRHLEVGGKKYLLLLAAALALHFTTKETSFIYTAEALIFLAVYFIAQVTRNPWENAEKDYRAFIVALGIALLLAATAVSYGMYTRDAAPPSAAETAVPSNPNAPTSPLAAPESSAFSPVVIIALVTLLVIVAAAYFLIRGYTWERIRNERSFDLLMVCGTIVLPMLTPFPIKFLEKYLMVTIPTTAPEVQALSADPQGILTIAGFLILMFAISAMIGLLWNKEKWWQIALVFWVPFTILYTTVFTNSDGFFTGTIGSLGYWLVQQSVERGSQPWYYYLLVQIPIYEFLPALGFFLALIVGLRVKSAPRAPVAIESAPATNEPVAVLSDGDAVESQLEEEVLSLITAEEMKSEEKNFPNTFSLLVWWSVVSVVAFSAAGERMPWLTYHMALPLILITGWALGRLIDTTDWERLAEKQIPLTLATLAIFIVSITGMMIALSGSTPPFQGKDLAQLQATSAFLLPTIIAILSAAGLTYLFREWTFKDIRHVFALIFFALLSVLTMRASFRASYITYDQATEFLVYAHGATGIKEVIAQAKEISERTTGGMGVAIAYDASAPDTGVSWPFVWYLRDFTNQRSFDQPTRSLRDSSVIIVDEKNFDKIEAAIGPGYYRMDYIRMWWPMQDYFGLVYDRDPKQPFTEDYACSGIFSVFKLNKSKDYSRFCEGFTNPQIRAALFKIWWDRDYTKYAEVKGRSDLTLTTWSPADKMRLYIRQDVTGQMWNYGVAPAAVESAKDPTEGKYVLLSADLTWDTANGLTLNAPRSLAFAKDGTLYIADSRNHRVVHVDTEGKVLHQWGAFADGVSTPMGDGTFNEPWGIAVAPDGSVYVTDTWNHRIEKFDKGGRYITAWGTFGQGDTPTSFYGPRGLAVDSKGRVYVTDTGNKRVVVFDANGGYLTQFGSAGFEPGQFDEPVGITVGKNGTVYVVDTWNQRIQTFTPIESDSNLVFVPEKQWDVYGWFGQSLDNKPFIAVNDAGHVFITDPDGFRVMEFDPNGAIIRVWGDFGNTSSGFGLPSGITVDSKGRVWVTDSVYNRVMRFTTP